MATRKFHVEVPVTGIEVYEIEAEVDPDTGEMINEEEFYFLLGDVLNENTESWDDGGIQREWDKAIIFGVPVAFSVVENAVDVLDELREIYG
jgi:hypothetical protein